MLSTSYTAIIFNNINFYKLNQNKTTWVACTKYWKTQTEYYFYYRIYANCIQAFLLCLVKFKETFVYHIIAQCLETQNLALMYTLKMI